MCLGGVAHDMAASPTEGAARAGRVWCAARKPLRARLRALGARAGGRVAAEVVAPDGTIAARGPAGADGSSLELVTGDAGWYELRVLGSGLPAPTPYELDVTYTATPHL